MQTKALCNEGIVSSNVEDESQTLPSQRGPQEHLPAYSKRTKQQKKGNKKSK